MGKILSVFIDESGPQEPETLRALVEKIKVIDKHHVEFQFICGINEQEEI